MRIFSLFTLVTFLVILSRGLHIFIQVPVAVKLVNFIAENNEKLSHNRFLSIERARGVVPHIYYKEKISVSILLTDEPIDILKKLDRDYDLAICLKVGNIFCEFKNTESWNKALPRCLRAIQYVLGPFALDLIVSLPSNEIRSATFDFNDVVNANCSTSSDLAHYYFNCLRSPNNVEKTIQVKQQLLRKPIHFFRNEKLQDRFLYSSVLSCVGKLESYPVFIWKFADESPIFQTNITFSTLFLYGGIFVGNVATCLGYNSRYIIESLQSSQNRNCTAVEGFVACERHSDMAGKIVRSLSETDLA